MLSHQGVKLFKRIRSFRGSVSLKIGFGDIKAFRASPFLPPSLSSTAEQNAKLSQQSTIPLKLLTSPQLNIFYHHRNKSYCFFFLGVNAFS